MCEGFLHGDEGSAPTNCLNSSENICTECSESHLLVNNTCVGCPVEHCHRCSKTTCLKCGELYRANTDRTACLPVQDPVVFAMSEVELKCFDGASSVNGTCQTCGQDGCVACTMGSCSVCSASRLDGRMCPPRKQRSGCAPVGCLVCGRRIPRRDGLHAVCRPLLPDLHAVHCRGVPHMLRRHVSRRFVLLMRDSRRRVRVRPWPILHVDMRGLRRRVRRLRRRRMYGARRGVLLQQDTVRQPRSGC